MPNEPTLVTTRSHVPPLDGLRGIAVLLVLWAHVPPDLGGNVVGILNKIVQPGYLGVDIFFVLSGFLITRILMYERENKKPLRYFLIRRAFRIFPIYYLLIGVLIFLAPGEYLIWCATYLSNFVFSFDGQWNAEVGRWVHESNPMRHTWSLCVEEHFYMIWPLIIYFAPRDTLKPIAMAVVISGMILGLMASVFAGELPLLPLLYRGTPFRAISLALGGLFALYEPSIGVGKPRAWQISGSFFVPAVALLASTLLFKYPWDQSIKLIGFSLLSSSIFFAAVGMEHLGPKVSSVLSKGPLAYVGRISYGVYLYHFPIYYALGIRDKQVGPPPWLDQYPVFDFLRVLHEHAQAPLLLTLLGVVLTFVVSSLSYYALERPLLKYASRYR